jgi:hypothetical protein
MNTHYRHFCAARFFFMKQFVLVTLILVSATACDRTEMGSPSHPVTAYVNGHWYTGTGFVSKSMYEQAGRFVDLPATPVARTVDLDGSFVVPAFAEGHHHMVLCEPGRLQTFSESGILYAGILNARVTSRECQDQYHGPDSVEVVNALAGITARNAHPSQIGRYFLDEADIDGEWVYYVDNASELDGVLRRIESNRPDILKVFLSYMVSGPRSFIDRAHRRMGAGRRRSSRRTRDVCA